MVRLRKTEIFSGKTYKRVSIKTTYSAAKTEAAKYRANGLGAIVKLLTKDQYAVYVTSE